jgi:hypothetical protein
LSRQSIDLALGYGMVPRGVVWKDTLFDTTNQIDMKRMTLVFARRVGLKNWAA